jgi:hypothetical protein
MDSQNGMTTGNWLTSVYEYLMNGCWLCSKWEEKWKLVSSKYAYFCWMLKLKSGSKQESGTPHQLKTQETVAQIGSKQEIFFDGHTKLDEKRKLGSFQKYAAL